MVVVAGLLSFSGMCAFCIHVSIAAISDAPANCNGASHAHKLVLMRPRGSAHASCTNSDVRFSIAGTHYVERVIS